MEHASACVAVQRQMDDRRIDALAGTFIIVRSSNTGQYGLLNARLGRYQQFQYVDWRDAIDAHLNGKDAL